MTVTRWRVKRGDDFTAPQAIHVTDGGVDVDLSDEAAWSVLAQARVSADATTVAATFGLGDLLADSKVVLTLTAAETAVMKDRLHVVDVQVTNLDTDRVQSCETIELLVVADVTREEPA